MPNVSLSRWLGCICIIAVISLISACGSEGAVTVSVKLTPSPTDLVLPSATGTVVAEAATVTPTPAPTAPDTILIWWPGSLYPTANSPAARVLRDQLDAYRTLNAKTISIRVKRDDGLGGILETLQSGSLVAPSTMPDLTLMRRNDLVQAASVKLLASIDVSTFSPDDLFSSGLSLGRVNGTQYGLPYTLELQHAIYRTSTLATPPLTLDDLLKSDQAYLFPAGTPKGVNNTLLAQYLAAGGRLADEKGTSTLDLAPLQSVLRFYEQAAANKLTGAQLLDYTASSQYLPLLTNGKANIGQIDSTSYLAQRANLTGIATTAVPLPAGGAVVQVDGWLWVVTTTDPDRQAQALGVLAWLMRPDQQGRFTQAFGMLPSRRSALTAWTGDPYAAFVRPLLDQPAVPPPDTLDPAATSALQKAFEDVLSGRKSAELASSDAEASVSGTK